jgi:predicted GIY-YIG superfamily endonuclease
MIDSLQEFADNCGPDAEGTVYLLHFDRPLHHAQHYMGWTTNLEQRLHAHETGNGSRLMEVVSNAGITWRLAKTWEGPRALERKLKRQHHGPRLCPICNGGAI